VEFGFVGGTFDVEVMDNSEHKSDTPTNVELILPAAPAKRLKRGRRLGKYRLEKRLGEGGFCEVWRARDTVEGIHVALKIPHLDKFGRRDNQAILREVRHVAQLRHRHIMPIKNADIIEGHAVLATELSVGTLDDRGQPMVPRKILPIIAQVLEGLAYAHQHRLTHCDVTPGNIFLFPDGRAALGDFGISVQIKGRMGTIDDFGTPGYVAPEQAYGKPTYSSDCFAVGLILYEYLTGVLLRWPFAWPGRGHKRLKEKAGGPLIAFLRRALSVSPSKRFAHAGDMLNQLLLVAPEAASPHLEGNIPTQKKTEDWRRLRREVFAGRYQKIFPHLLRCVDCHEPIDETMSVCPWCSSTRNRYDTRSRFSHICPRCHRGVLPEWRFCPWCYGPGFKSPAESPTPGVRYHDKCCYCHGKIMRFMRYCPWCRRKIRKTWQIRPFPEICNQCHGPVDTDFWNYCPWCAQNLNG